MDPIFSAVSNNANHLYTLLRCIGFAPKASVQITPEGLRFSVEEARVMQGLAFLDKALFTNFTFNPPSASNEALEKNSNGGADVESDDVVYPHFLISLSALLETLQIFGINDTSTNNSSSFSTTHTHQQTANVPSAFTTPALLLDRSCTIRYLQPGSPLTIILTEAGVTTTCELSTYSPEESTLGGSSTIEELEIPLQRDAITMKIIMRSAWLHNAISELDSTNPSILTVSASAKREPFFALSGSGGPFSESTVEFSIEDQTNSNKPGEASNIPSAHHYKTIRSDGKGSSSSSKRKPAPTVTETFLVNPPPSMGTRVKQNYRFALIRKASRAMAVANKVSIRGDIQGVLSLQFMIELGGDNSSAGAGSISSGNGGATSFGGVPGPGGSAAFGSNVSFVDFRFVPLIDDDEEQGGEGDDAEDVELDL